MFASTEISQMARADFTKAMRTGFQRLVANWLAHGNNSLLSFEEVIKQSPSQGRHDAGLQTVAVENIVGSVGRCHDFDRGFRPRCMEQLDRWMRVDKAYHREINLPPVQLYKVGENYFVVDGHHRVSVARAHEQVFIDAYVIEFDTQVSSEEGMDEE
jgi:hypothetical protein